MAAMEMSTEPLVVVQTNRHGRGMILCLAYEKDRVGKGAADMATNFHSKGRTGDLATIARGSNQSGTGAVSRAPIFRPGLWTDLRARSRRPRRSTIQPAFLLLRHSMTVDKLAPFLSVYETPKKQEQAAKRLAEISSVEENRSRIANSSQAMAGLTRLLFVDNPCSSYAAAALGNLAAIEDNLLSFKKFPDTLTGLVKLLFRYDDVLARKEAATALANLSLWREGRKMILDTSQSIKGLIELASVPQNGSSHQYCGQEEAKSALLTLALSEDNRPILDCPISLAALAGCFSIHEKDGRSTRSRVMRENAVKALAKLSCTKENAKKIANSSEFRLFLAVLVQVLGNRNPPTSSIELASENGLAVRKKAAIALANLSITEDVQRMVAEFPNALAALFISLRARDDGSALCSQLRECAAMTLGNLALAKENRRKIVYFGTDGLAGLASLLFEDDNPAGQEYAAWAFGNLSHDPHDSEDIAVKIAADSKVVRGLARLLQLPTKPESGSRSRIGAQEQSVRALANLTHPHASQVQIARVPDVVRALAAALLSRRCHQKLSPTSLEYAARAIANLTCAKENWRSAEIFDDALRALVDVVSTDNVEATQKTRKYGAFALGNFALAPSHHRAIVESKHAMTGLVRMLFSRDTNGVGKEQAARVLAHLAHGELSIKSTIASIPLAVTGLQGLLSDRESLLVQNQARRALADLRDVLVDSSVSKISVARPPIDVAKFAHLRPILQGSSRAGARI